jgi:bacillithiol system protein YtxJ
MSRWIELNHLSQIDEIKAASGYNLIFKHSTRCSISLMAKRGFESDWEVIPTNINLYFLDLIKYRDISSYIAETFHVHHESPQALLIKDGECILDSSHGDISANEFAETINA